MIDIPRPGQRVRGSASGAPIMALFDLLGRRWAMGVLWTLCEIGPATFRAVAEKCDSISPTVLNARLKELQAARFVEKSSSGYVATDLGRRVYDQLVPLGQTAKLWSRVLADKQTSEDQEAVRGEAWPDSAPAVPSSTRM